MEPLITPSLNQDYVLAPIIPNPGKKLLSQLKLNDEDHAQIIRILSRAPTHAELGVFSAMWSEHCSYKSSRVHLKRLPSEGDDVVVGPGENAGVVRLWNKLCLAFKMESHNHPSFIEPYQGAATGVGGILRDIFCMGARPIANLNALRFGERDHQKTAWLLEGVVSGIGDYGNCVGVPTVGGSINFDSSYNGNILVNAMTIGLVNEDEIFKGYASGLGNLVVYVGSATGRDGIHGATMASDSFSSAEGNDRSAIQVGDPFCEKLLLEATLEALASKLVIGIQDMGAAGLTSSLFEMAERAKSGLFIDLDQVPVRCSDMSAQDLLLSESQERMVMVIEQSNWPKLQEIFSKWQLEHAVIGAVTNSGKVEASYRGLLELDVPIAPLVECAPSYDRQRSVRKRDLKRDQAFEVLCEKTFLSTDPDILMGRLAKKIGDKRSIYQQFDYQVGNQTSLGSKQGGAAVLWISKSRYANDDPSFPEHLGIAANAGCLEKYCRINAEEGAAHTVAKLARGLRSCGARPIAVTDCLNYGNPNIPEVMAEISDGIDGIAKACNALAIPVVSGNVSLYNETDAKSIAPTPMIGMVGKILDVRKARPAIPKDASSLFVIRPKDTLSRLATASLVAECCQLDLETGQLPLLCWEAEKESNAIVERLIENDVLNAARDVGQGGIIAASMHMAFGSELSLNISCDYSLDLFLEGGATYLLASTNSLAELKENLVEIEMAHCEIYSIGTVFSSPEKSLKISSRSFSWQNLHRAYRELL